MKKTVWVMNTENEKGGRDTIPLDISLALDAMMKKIFKYAVCDAIDHDMWPDSYIRFGCDADATLHAIISFVDGVTENTEEENKMYTIDSFDICEEIGIEWEVFADLFYTEVSEPPLGWDADWTIYGLTKEV